MDLTKYVASIENFPEDGIIFRDVTPLMAVFTKNFWDKKGRDRRERTLEVLRAYGDSTTVLINKPIEQIIR